VGKWKAADWAIIILTLSVSSIIIATAWSIGIRGNHLDDSQTKVIGGVIAGIISIISMYIGAIIQKKADRNGD